jgi:hypothetical protein
LEVTRRILDPQALEQTNQDLNSLVLGNIHLLVEPNWTLPALTPAQTHVLQTAKRFNVLVCGRRWGKTSLSAYQHALNALQGKRSGYFAPRYKLLTETWRAVEAVLGDQIKHSDRTEKRIETFSGGVIDFWTLQDSDAGRSKKYHMVDIDEAALVPNLEEIWYKAIRPSLADYSGCAWFRSSPKGLNYFHQLYLKGQNEGTEWISWRYPTITNPYIDPAEIAKAKEDMPAIMYEQEFEAAFNSDATGVFLGVQKVSVLEPKEPEGSGRYYFGVDWGKVNDFTVISVWDATKKEEVFLDRFNQIGYGFQERRLMELYEKYNPVVVLAESNSIGAVMIDNLLEKNVRIMPFVTTNLSKNLIIERLQLAIEREQVQLLDNPIATGEMMSYTIQKTATGLSKYSAPSGGHDDTVDARAIGYYAIGSEIPEKPTGAGYIGGYG